MTDRAAEARSHRSRAAAHTRRGKADAQRAADAYVTAADWLTHAAWLTARPGMWMPEAEVTPAAYEATAASWTRIGDIWLRSSFHADGQAAFYRDLAARYAGQS